jgi:diguanylate cyclase (GGDEF)-like protein
MPGPIARIRSSLSLQTALIIAVPLVLVLVYHAYLEYEEDRDRLLRGVQMQILRIAEMFQGPADDHLGQGRRKDLQRFVEETALGADMDLVAVYGPDGRVIAADKPGWTGRPMDDMHPEELTSIDLAAVRKGLQGGYSSYYDPDDGQYCMVMPAAGGGATLLSMDLASLTAQMKAEAWRVVPLSVLAALIIGASTYLLFQRLVVARLRRITDASRKLAEGDLDADLRDRGTDEIGHLAASINVLAEDVRKWRGNLEEMVVHRVKELSTLYEVVRATSRSLELDRMPGEALDAVCENMGKPAGLVAISGDDGVLRVLARHGIEQACAERFAAGRSCIVPAASGVGGALALTVERGGPREYLEGLETARLRSAIVVPLNMRGAARGLFALFGSRPHEFSKQDEALLTTVGSQLGVAVENALLYERTLHLSRVDGLTGLANRRHLVEQLGMELARAERYGMPLSVAILDLDRFKVFNDRFGHLAGDDLLRSFGAMLKAMARRTDVAGRYGGEEFAVVLAGTPLDGAAVFAERVRAATEGLAVPAADGNPQTTTVSIGIAEHRSGDTEEILLKRADDALYRAKAAGRNRVER